MCQTGRKDYDRTMGISFCPAKTITRGKDQAVTKKRTGFNLEKDSVGKDKRGEGLLDMAP